MEHLLQPPSMAAELHLLRVSILIFMEHLLQLSSICSFLLHQNLVSILIFMEHLLQLLDMLFSASSEFSFNPYFYGTSTSTN